MHYGTYCSEVYRAGLRKHAARPVGGCTALNLSGLHTFRDVIMPQAIPPVVPALGNYLVALFKETPLLSAIAVLELMQTAKILGSENFRYTEPITLVGLFFLVFSLVAAASSAWSSPGCSAAEVVMNGLQRGRRANGPLRQGDQELRRLTVLDQLDLESPRARRSRSSAPRVRARPPSCGC